MEVDVNDNNFETEVLKEKLPVLVDFWAEWCGPCRMIAPVVDEIASEYEGKVKVCKVNVDDAQKLAAKFGIMSIPTLVIFKAGKVMDKMVGVVAKGDIISKLSAHIGK